MLRKTSEGNVYLAIGGLLSAIALLGIFLYQMLFEHVQQYGGTYSFGVILIVSYMLLPIGGAFAYVGARLVRSRFALVVPSTAGLTLLALVIQIEWCIYYCVHP